MRTLAILPALAAAMGSESCNIEATQKNCANKGKDDNQKCAKPDEDFVVSENTVKAHLQCMADSVKNHEVPTNVSFLHRISAGKEGKFHSYNRAMKTFAHNQGMYSYFFRDYLKGVVDKLATEYPDEKELHAIISGPILENIKEEEGNYEDDVFEILKREGNVEPEWVQGYIHKDLFRNFLDKLGIDTSRFGKEHLTEIPSDAEKNMQKMLMMNNGIPGIMFTQYMLHITKNETACRGLAVLAYAIEDTVSIMYKFIWEGLKKMKGELKLTDQDFVFFPLHILVDDGHAELLKEAYAHLLKKNDGSCVDADQLVMDVLNKRADFFSGIETIADAGAKGENSEL